MNEKFACFEVTSDSIRLILGSVDDRSPFPFLEKEIAIPGIISRGIVQDEEALVAALSQFHRLEDPHTRVVANISSACLVLPALDFGCFHGAKSTNTVSSTVSAVDISNAISLFQKDSLREKVGYSVIDIIPQEFVLEDGRRFYEPPLGETSSTLMIEGLVHLLPSEVVSSYTNCFLKAGFRIEKVSVNSHCDALALGLEANLPKDALLINLGARITQVNLVRKGNSVASFSVFFGGDDITERLASSFSLTFEEAESLKKEYGYDPTPRLFSAPIGVSNDPSVGKISQEQWNAALLKAFEPYIAQLKATLDKLYGLQAQIKDLPLILSGGGSMLVGIKALLASILRGHEVYSYVPSVVGMRHPRYMSLVGSLLAKGNSYTGSLSDNHKNLAHVSRPAPKAKTLKRTSSPEDDSL